MIQSSPNWPTRSGFGYFIHGMVLCCEPKIRRFVILPLIANIILFGGAMYLLFGFIDDWMNNLISGLPSYLSFLTYLIVPLLAILIMTTFGYFFSTVANWIAAPFNGLLSEKLENQLTGNSTNDQTLNEIIKDVPRILHREWVKFKYYFPRAIGLFIILWIPAIGQTLGAVLWFLFAAWMLCIQYCDYPFDNHRVSFSKMKEDLTKDKMCTLTFGLTVAVFTMIPILNLFVMPIAVCGATAMWVDKYKAHNIDGLK